MARPWPTTIIPTHAWGNYDLIGRALRADLPRPVFVDPSAYAPVYPDLGIPWDERERVWVSAALPDNQLLEWPVPEGRVRWDVQQFGNQKAGQANPTEAEVYASYQRALA